MEQIFDFLRDYWWLIFPAFAVASAVGGAWERGARRRHRRRLEVLHAKAELKAAARGTAPVPIAGATAGQQPVTGAKTSPVPTGTQLERLFAAHDTVTARWLEYELDVAKIIAFPAMSDGRQPLTAAFLRAKRIADGLRPASAKARLSKDQLAEYRNAVADYEVAFDVAERDARRLKDSTFTEVERKRLDTAKQLLTVAIDQAATPAERQLAYRRVRQELDGLISLSDEAIEVLETKVALELPPSAPAATGGTPAEKAPDAAPPRVSTTQPPATDAARPAGAQPVPAPWPVPARPQPDPAPGRVIRPKSHP